MMIIDFKIVKFHR